LSATWRQIHLLLQAHLACVPLFFGLGVVDAQLGGRAREPFHATLSHQLSHFLWHVALVLDQDVLMLDVELAEAEVEHFHDFFKLVVARFHDFLRLLQPELDDVEFVGVEVQCYDVKLVSVHAHLNYALYVVLSDHAEVAPENFAPPIEQHGPVHVDRAFGNQNFQHIFVVSEHWLRHRRRT